MSSPLNVPHTLAVYEFSNGVVFYTDPYLHYLLTERQLSWSSCNVAASAIRFFYVDTLGWTSVQLNLPPRPGQKQLPRGFRQLIVTDLMTEQQETHSGLDAHRSGP